MPDVRSRQWSNWMGEAMRGPFDGMFRWWKQRNGNGRYNGRAKSAVPTVHNAPVARQNGSPHEPPWFAQLDREGIPRSLRYPTATLVRILDQAAERFGDNHALIYNTRRWTYREL